MAGKYFSTSEAAKICQVTPGSVIRWVNEGQLETALTVGGHRRIPAASLIQLVKKLGLLVPKELSDPFDPKDDDDGPKILIVDDEEGVRGMIAWLINQEWPEAKVEQAEDGFVAGWKCNGFRPDLVILDLMMPAVDGFHFCQFIRNTPEMKHTRIIAISGVQGSGNEEKILKLGADVFLAKPFDDELLRKTVEEQLKWNWAKKTR